MSKSVPKMFSPTFSTWNDGNGNNTIQIQSEFVTRCLHPPAFTSSAVQKCQLSAPKASWNKCFFRLALNTPVSRSSWRAAGNRFQSAGLTGEWKTALAEPQSQRGGLVSYRIHPWWIREGHSGEDGWVAWLDKCITVISISGFKVGKN
jgi:hypothetical protein